MNMMQEYHDLLADIIDFGEDSPDRTGVGTRRLFAQQLRFDLRRGFPAVTTKRLAWKAVTSELLWFLEGSHDERRLAQILHGTTDAAKRTIWTDNAQADYWQDRAQYDGDLGRIYGVQWRDWRNSRGEQIDQILDLVEGIKRDPTSRRHILTAWNPGELNQMALPPCHVMSQYYVSNRGEISCHMYQRSVDAFLGLPFNIASYALFTHLLAHVTKLKVGELVISTGDTHVYRNHFEQVLEQLGRDHYDPPQLRLTSQHRDITMFTMDQIHLDNYQSHGPIRAEMAV